MPRQYALAPSFGQPATSREQLAIDRAQLAAERERRLAEAQQHADEYRTQSLGLRRDALTDTGERFAVSEKRQQALADSTISNQKLTGQKTAFELKQANDKAKREQTALKYFTVANVLESSIDDPRAFDLNPEVAAFWRKKYPNLDNMTREQKMQLATMRRRYGQDLIDGKGVEASVLRASQARDAATERERVAKELQEKNLTAAGEMQTAGFDAAKEREALRLQNQKDFEAFKQTHKEETSKAATEEAINALDADLNLVGEMTPDGKILPGRAVRFSQREALRRGLESGLSVYDAAVRAGIKVNNPKVQTQTKWFGMAADDDATAQAQKDAEAEQESRLKNTYLKNGEFVTGRPAAFAPDTTAPQRAFNAPMTVEERQMAPDMPPGPQPAALTPQPAPDISTARTVNGAVSRVMEQRETAAKAAEEAKKPATVADKYNLLNEVLQSNRNPNTGQPLTAAEITQVKAAMANFKKRLTTPE